MRNARKGDGPTLVECRTYRKLGHYVGDPAAYRPKEEEAKWEKLDPINIFKKHLAEQNIATEEELEKIEEDAIRQVGNAIDYAKKSPDPEPTEAMEHVYHDWRWGGEYR